MPDRSDDYQLPSFPKAKITRELWNEVFKDIADRIKERELLEASFELLQEQGVQAALDYIQVSIAPQLSSLQKTIADSQARIDELLQGNAPNAQKLGGQLPAYYAKATETASSITALTDDLALVSAALGSMLVNLNATRRDSTFNRDQFRNVPVKTVTNLNIRSEGFDNGSWAKSGTAIVANTTSAPDGNATADKVNETATNAEHLVGLGGQAVTPGQPFTRSIWVKAAERDTFRIRLATNIGFVGDAYFDLTAGTIIGRSTNIVDADIEYWGGGWYRCYASALAPAGSTTANGSAFYIVTRNQSTGAVIVNYLGVVGSGLFLWGAQFENGVSKPGHYVPTTTAVATASVFSNRHLAEELAAKVLELQNAINGIGVVPLGTVIDVYGNGSAAIPGFLKVVPGLEVTAAYPELRQWALDNGWATNANGNPVMPNGDALFKRGWRSAQTRDAGRVFGSIQEDAMQGHRHSRNPENLTEGILAGPGSNGGFASTWTYLPKTSDTTGNPVTDSVNGAPRTASETRPVNLTVTYYIKAYPASVSAGSVDVAKLADDIAAVASRSTALEKANVAFESANQPYVVNGPGSVAHGLGAKPSIFFAKLVCTTADNGWAVGEEFDLASSGYVSNAAYGLVLWATATTINWRIASAGLYLINKTTGNIVIAPTANWALKLRGKL